MVGLYKWKGEDVKPICHLKNEMPGNEILKISEPDFIYFFFITAEGFGNRKSDKGKDRSSVKIFGQSI